MDKYIIIDWVKAFVNTIWWALATLAGMTILILAVAFGIDFASDFITNYGKELTQWFGIIVLIGLVGFMFKTELDEARRKRIKKGVRPEEIS